MSKLYKGIVLAGGSGSRLFPITEGTSKQLLPIYDKPMVYYSISVLMLSGIREILIISTPEDMPVYKRLLGNGSQFGIEFRYEIQKKPQGLAQAFLIGKNFIGNDNVSLVLGDNIFFGYGFSKKLHNAVSKESGATLFGYYVKNPEDFGVVEIDSNNKILSIEEKPIKPKSNYVLTGLYYYDNDVVSIAETIKPSSRGELEISDINKIYLNENKINLEILGRGFAWLDTGTHKSLIDAGKFVETVEDRQGLKIACLEEIAFRMGWISIEDLKNQAQKYIKSSYGQYIKSIYENY